MLCIIMIVILGAVIIYQFIDQICPECPTGYHKGCKKTQYITSPETTDDRLARYTFWLAIFTGVLSASTIGLWVATEVGGRRQSREARRTIETMERTERRQLRAYVFTTAAQIEAADGNGRILSGQQIQAGFLAVSTMTITNTGQTPAYDLSVRGHIQITNWPLVDTDLEPLDFNEPVSMNSYGAGNHTMRFDRFREVISEADEQALRGKTKAIFVYGEIRYRDAFGNAQWTRYRYFTGGISGIRGIMLASHERGNEAS